MPGRSVQHCVGWLTGFRRARQAVPRPPRSAPGHRTEPASAALATGDGSPRRGLAAVTVPDRPRIGSRRCARRTHSSTSASIQPTARAPKATRAGGSSPGGQPDIDRAPRQPRAVHHLGQPQEPHPRGFVLSLLGFSVIVLLLLVVLSRSRLPPVNHGRRGGFATPPPDAAFCSAINARIRSAVAQRRRPALGASGASGSSGRPSALLAERRRATGPQRAEETRLTRRNRTASFQRSPLPVHAERCAGKHRQESRKYA